MECLKTVESAIAVIAIQGLSNPAKAFISFFLSFFLSSVMAPMFQEAPVAATAAKGAADGAANGLPLKSRASLLARTLASHPTRSLQFLRKLDEQEATEPLQAKVKLRVIVVGGGLGGLACAIALARRGHTVTVLEQAVQLGEVGKGGKGAPAAR